MLTSTVKSPSYSKWASLDYTEYLLAVQPSQEVFKRLAEEKAEFCNEYGDWPSADASLQLNVACFLAKEEMEETLIRWMQRICTQHKAFPVQLNNFSSFPPHTIYIRVQDPLTFQGLGQQLKVIDDFLDPPLHLIARPHITLASRLPLAVYEDAIKKYALKDFHETFMVTELVLLSRAHPLDRLKRSMFFTCVSKIILQQHR